MCSPSPTFVRALIHGSAGRTDYVPRGDDAIWTKHWGQRKLLLSEIEFLVQYGDKAKLVLYVGAAPGTHIGYLSDLFPEHRFILFDPLPFVIKPRREMIECRREIFTNDTAQEFVGHNCLFISDIRSVNVDDVQEEELDAVVSQDMLAQQRWVQIIQPIAACLKFRLPWCAGKTEYLKGTIFYPVWGRPSTSESRLVVERHAGTSIYDNLLYSEEMCYFNSVLRVAHFSHSVQDDGPGLDHCYDCTAEIHILGDYLEHFNFCPTPEDKGEMIKEFSNEISQNLCRTRIVHGDWVSVASLESLRIKNSKISNLTSTNSSDGTEVVKGSVDKEASNAELESKAEGADRVPHSNHSSELAHDSRTGKRQRVD
jgi:hypothetical protein